jgi:vacuolar-type H+-ATPase subunit F/Vma7
MPAPVLLLAPEAASQSAAEALRRSMDVSIERHSSLRAALSALRQSEFSLILLDETLAAAEPETVERIYQTAAAPVLELNFAISSAPRIVRQARATLVRRTRDLALAQSAAAAQLHGELNQTLSGLLLESELALRAATPAQAPKLRELVHLAGQLRDRLRPTSHLQG